MVRELIRLSRDAHVKTINSILSRVGKGEGEREGGFYYFVYRGTREIWGETEEGGGGSRLTRK